MIIQTAYTGDVILATAVIEKIHIKYPDSTIDFLLRKGNEGLLAGHPLIKHVHVWNKQTDKKKNLVRLITAVRKEEYTHVINLHRFATSGIITFLSGARYKAGFDKNPFAFCYTRKAKHIISEPYAPEPIHEIQRNQQLIAGLTDPVPAMPKLYPGPSDYAAVREFAHAPYVCIAPSSVWFTKQFPAEKWISLIREIPAPYAIYIIGAPSDKALGDSIKAASGRENLVVLCGKLSYLQSAALMEGAVMNYSNDSAPLHIASAMNAPVTAVFCSTVPAFGFGPLRENGRIVEIGERLYCRPCGLHGHKACPEGHFRCAGEITNQQLLWWTSKKT